MKGTDGFYGANSTERFPTDVAIKKRPKKQLEKFTALRLRLRKS